MRNQKMKKTMNGAIILSLASLIAKILSAVYRVPFQNMVGNTGFYVYQQVYPIYGIGMTIALSGFPVFLSKLFAEASDPAIQRRLLKRSFILLYGFSFISFLLLYIGAGFVALLMGDVRLAPVIQAVSWLFLLLPFLAVGRGFFQGRFDMVPTAVSQVIEQFSRVGIILTAAYFYTRMGWNEYQMGAAAMSSSWISGMIACLILAGIFYFQRGGKNYERTVSSGNSVFEHLHYRTLAKRFVTEGFVICLLSSTLILLQLIDSFTLYRGLMQSGILSETAKNLKGIYDRGQPLVQVGVVLSTAFSSSFLPSLSHYFVQKRERDYYRSARSLVRITAAIAVPATVGMVVLMPYLNDFLFGDNSGNLVLCLYVLAVALMSMIQAYSAILQSSNHYREPLVALIAALIVKLVLNSRLVFYLGAAGASAATVLGLAAMLGVMWFRSPYTIRKSLIAPSFVLKLFFCCSVMAAAVVLTTNLLEILPFAAASRWYSLLVALCGTVTGATVFVYGVLKLKVLTLREWLSLPFGKKILRR